MNTVQKYDKVLFNILIPLYFYSNILATGFISTRKVTDVLVINGRLCAYNSVFVYII